jgi:uncharacterized UPF0160 family protein
MRAVKTDRPVKVCTHDGIFHADEVLAVEILAAHYGAGRLSLVRSRDPSHWSYADVVVDVGARYDVESAGETEDGVILTRYWLDHHQKGGAGVRAGGPCDGIPYAAAGLTWATFGLPLLCSLYPAETAEVRQQIWDAADRLLVAPVDAADTGFELVEYKTPGVRPLTISGLVSLCNPDDSDAARGRQARGFDGAREVMGLALRETIHQAAKWVAARRAVARAVTERPHKFVAVIHPLVPWQEHIVTDPAAAAVLYVVYKQPGGASPTWMCQCVPDGVGSFGKRKALPAEWAGLRGEELARKTGVADAVFCHPGAFVCGAGSKEGALTLADLAWKS